MDDFIKIIEDLKNSCDDSEPYVSAKIVAKKLNLSVWSVYKLAQTGKIASRKFGHSRRFQMSKL